VRKILHVIPAIAPRYGGPSAAIVGMCRALRDAGTAVTIATTDADGPYRLPAAIGSVQPWAGIDTIMFPRRLGEGVKWSPALASWLMRQVAAFDAVHVHAVFSHSSLAAGRACRRRSVPYIVRPLGTLDPWSVRRKGTQKRVLLSLGGRAMLAGASAMHYTSAEEQRLAESTFPYLGRGAVVPLGLDDVYFRCPDRGPAGCHATGPPYVLTLSRLDAKKGIDILIKSFRALETERAAAGWRLVIAGSGDAATEQRLRALAQGARSIEFAGWVDGDAKRRLLAGAGLFVLPSSQENFGIALLEALALGVPAVITPGVNLAADVAGAGAGWIAERRLESLAAAMRHAIGDEDERRRRGQAARTFAASFTWPAVAARLNDLYASVSH
jgi:glycosyltransferase involved in cell wall biosynthesis